MKSFDKEISAQISAISPAWQAAKFSLSDVSSPSIVINIKSSGWEKGFRFRRLVMHARPKLNTYCVNTSQPKKRLS